MYYQLVKLNNMNNFDFNAVRIEDVKLEKHHTKTYQSLKELISKLQVNQSFAIPKSFKNNVGYVTRREFPELRLTVRKVADSDFVRVYRVL